MNKPVNKLIAVVLGCALLGASPLAVADKHRGPDRHDGRHGKHYDRGHDRGHGPGWHGKPGRHDSRHDHRGPSRWRPDPPPRHWVRGEHVPLPYRGHQYVISDWRGYHLSAPPRGYQWIGVGADYFLIGVATGVVLQAVLGN